MIIKHCYIKKFRLLEDTEFDLGEKLTAIVGHNGTLKTTLLGILSQTFSIGKNSPLYGATSVDGYNFKSQFKDKFKLTNKDKAGEHNWRIELYPGLYKDDCFEAVSINRKGNSDSLRFVSTDGKKKGNGYIQVPVYFLSLKRVTPIGEETSFRKGGLFSIEDQKFLLSEYENILGICDSTIIETIESKNKKTIAMHESNIDAETISAGQDNVGKILMIVLSFRKLKEKYKEDYKGGIILIDEIESTIHPEAQKRLIRRMAHFSKEYNIQFIYTTHSPTIVRETNEYCKNKNDSKVVYLKKISNQIKCFTDSNTDEIVAELNGLVFDVDNPKLKIYTEDEVGRYFCKSLLKGYGKYIDYPGVTLGAEEYLEIVRAKLIDISKCLIILDGDKNNQKIKRKINNLKTKNISFLPGGYLPEKVLYEYLHNLEETDSFWDNSLGGYDKHKCFSDYPNLNEKEAEKYKKWYSINKVYWGNGCSKLYDRWKKDNNEIVEECCKEFVTKYNSIFKSNI